MLGIEIFLLCCCVRQLSALNLDHFTLLPGQEDQSSGFMAYLFLQFNFLLLKVPIVCLRTTLTRMNLLSQVLIRILCQGRNYINNALN